jgi:hypothetical protein
MRQTTTPAPSATSSFAGLLAALAAPASSAANRTPAWIDDGLEDDVATLSYERALSAHARYRSDNRGDRSLADFPDPGLGHLQPPLPAASTLAAASATPQAAAPASADAEPWSSGGPVTALNRNLKCASITIRMSKAECAQLRKRAAEAGLTVSAYLRSCTFEAESLRALVKDTLAQLKPASSTKNQAASTPQRRSWLKWLLRLLSPWRLNQRIVQA